LSIAYITKKCLIIFNVPHFSQLSDFADMWEEPEEWNDCTILASGSHEYLGFVRSYLKHHEGPLIYSINIVFKGQQRHDIIHLLGVYGLTYARGKGWSQV
jgi:hypothetical protein